MNYVLVSGLSGPGIRSWTIRNYTVMVVSSLTCLLYPDWLEYSMNILRVFWYFCLLFAFGSGCFISTILDFSLLFQVFQILI